MTIEIAEYSALLVLPNLDTEAVHQIKQAAQELLAGVLVSVGPRFLEFDYSGRDTGRKVVSFLCRIAPVVGDAEGEVECHLTTDTDGTYFEFYTIQHSRLYRHEAELVRLPPAEVRLEGAEPELLSASGR